MINERTIVLSRDARLLLLSLLYHVRVGDHPNRNLADRLMSAFESDDLNEDLVARLGSSRIVFEVENDGVMKQLELGIMINVDNVNLTHLLDG